MGSNAYIQSTIFCQISDCTPRCFVCSEHGTADTRLFTFRFCRLFESHRKLQKLNHNLEDKLLNIVSFEK